MNNLHPFVFIRSSTSKQTKMCHKRFDKEQYVKYVKFEYARYLGGTVTSRDDGGVLARLTGLKLHDVGGSVKLKHSIGFNDMLDVACGQRTPVSQYCHLNCCAVLL